jgi:predicted metal-binding protein
MIKAEGQKPGIDELVVLAKEAGFTYAAPLAMESLEFREEVRSMCSADLCKSYGKSWSCPPAVGSIERARKTDTKWIWQSRKYERVIKSGIKYVLRRFVRL